MCTECGNSLFLEVLFIFLRSSSCNLYALAVLQLYFSPPAGRIPKNLFNETLETSYCLALYMQSK